MPQNRYGSECHLELLEGSLCFLGEFKQLQELSHFASYKECSERLDNPQEVYHKVLVEVGKAEEYLDILIGPWCRLVIDTAYVIQLYGDTS